MYVGPWHDQNERMVMQEEDRNVDTILRIKKREASDTRVREALKTLMPLRKLYRETDTIGKLALEVQVLSYLRHSFNIFERES